MTPAGRPRLGDDGVSIGDIHLHIDGDTAQAEMLRKWMKDVAITAAPDISRKIGYGANRRRRAGAY